MATSRHELNDKPEVVKNFSEESKQSDSDKEKILSSSTQLIARSFKSQEKTNENVPANRTLYQILRVEKNAPQTQIQKAYDELESIHNPDKGGDSGKFREIGHAYFVLNDEARRNEYNTAIDDVISEREYQEASLKIFINENGIGIYKRYDNMSEVPPFFEDIALVSAQCKPGNSTTPIMRPLKEDEILYMTGKLIKFSDYKQTFRDAVSGQEILDSFPTEGKIMLFRLSNDALEYSRYSRSGNFYNDAGCSQMAVAKVKILKNIEAELKSVRVVHEESYDGNSEVGHTRFEYLETDAINVAPLVARLSINTFVGVKNYPLTKFARIANQSSVVTVDDPNEINDQRCTIS